MTGKQILNYRIERMLGEGGMSSVYLGIHNQLDRKVAIKVLHPHLAANPHIRERFKNEAAAMANLQHPGIVALYDFLDQADGLYLIMEYVDGLPLDEYIRTITGPIPEQKTIDLFSKVLDAFDYAHRKGVVHRDIKPSNIMIGNNGDVKVLDFGIAKLVSSDNPSQKLTRTGMRMGTVLYMSPEQVKGQANIDMRSDIYSLGVTLFEMLTARSPYDEQHSSEFDIQVKIVNEPLPRAKTFYPVVSDAMQFIIDKATAKKPETRFQNCEEFKQAFRDMHKIVPETTYPANEPVKVTVRPQETAPKVSAKETQPVKNTSTGMAMLKQVRSILLVLIGAVIVVFIGITTIKEFKIKQQEKEEAEKRQETERKLREAHEQEVARQEEQQRKWEEERQQMLQEQQLREAEAKKQYYRQHPLEMVGVDCSSYTSSENGVTNLTIRVTNVSEYPVDYVKVYVEYYDPTAEPNKAGAQQEVIFKEIGAHSSQTMEGLYSPGGTSVKCTLIEIASQALQ